ncbi:MAG: divalent-cation tolerance protein CutA [Polynucleobacter sp.]|jgi:periplasmic divalent cation tolerance protein|nr:divalent-cation tolerance protein CutA [Polynucleobacter sp.]MDZ4056072.1 divalent-cation tolerance protein CutA [Polynucleobacter sp.]
MNQLLVVITSLPSSETAKELGRKLIHEKLAACVQIHGGVQSIYPWEGRLCEADEVLLVAKTTQAKWTFIRDYLKQHHPYDVPEIIAQAIDQYDDAYAQWIQAELDC